MVTEEKLQRWKQGPEGHGDYFQWADAYELIAEVEMWRRLADKALKLYSDGDLSKEIPSDPDAAIAVDILRARDR